MGLKAWWRGKFGKDVKTFTNEEIVTAYVNAGAEFGDVVSYIYMGECIGFADLLAQWEKTEAAYAELGYRTLSIDDFVSFGGYGKSIDDLLKVPRKEGEKAVLHAAYYRENFLGKVGMNAAVIEAMQGHAAVGHYVMPSTDHLKDH